MKKWQNPQIINLEIGDTKVTEGCPYLSTTYNPAPGGPNNPQYDKCKHYKNGYCYHPNYGVGDNNGNSAVQHWPCLPAPTTVS